MIRQFDVVSNPDFGELAFRPYLIVLQSDLVGGLNSAIVAPLIPRERLNGAARLNPLVTFQGRDFWIAIHELFPVDRRLLRTPLANMSIERDAIIAALDLLFTGF